MFLDLLLKEQSDMPHYASLPLKPAYGKTLSLQACVFILQKLNEVEV
jgi:hypothetical protein